MKTVFLVRHAQKVGQAGDPGIDATGVIQARLTGKYFRQLEVDQIISSTYLRAVKTAELIAQVANLDLYLDDRLIERMNWQSDEVSFEQFSKEWLKASRNRGYVPLWGDSSSETGSRVAQLIGDLEDESTSILVSHGGTIMDYLRTTFTDEFLLKLDSRLNLAEYHYHNCAITKLSFDEDEHPHLEEFHFTAHLD